MAELPDDVDVERPAAGVAVVAFTGEHDLATRPATSALLASLVEENGAVIVDFSKAEFVDASILEVVQEANRTARDRGTLFRLQLGTAPIVATIFHATGVSEEVECASTRAEALAGTGEWTRADSG
jgi:anti-anti-sigma factor